MAPTQHNTGSSCLSNNSVANSLHKTAASKVQSNSKSTSSSISNSSSNNNMSFDSNNSRRASLEGRTSTMEWPQQQESLLPIATRGLFYNDSFFEDARKDFDQAVKEVVDQWGHRSDQMDDLTSYRKLREFDLQDKNQAVSVSQDETSHKVVLDVKDFMRGDVKVKVIDENEIVVEGTFEKQDGGSVSKKSFRRSFTFPGLVKAEAVSSAMSSDGVLTVTVPKNNQRGTSSKLMNTQAQNSQNSTESMSSNISNSNSSFNDIESDFLLPVTRKGLFFEDSFFESARQNFEKSVQDVLNKRVETDSLDMEDNMDTYRSLREKNLRQENQAISVTEEKDHHKVVLDVKDFTGGDVKVKIVDENELTVEGKIEKQSGGASANKSFYRSFTFPGLIKSDAITSAISSDGILTVRVPKDKKQIELENTLSSNSIHSKKGEEELSQMASSKTTSQNMNNSNINVINECHSNSVLGCSSSESSLPVFEKGLFFHDDFFASARQDFKKAVKEVLNNSGEITSLTDDMSAYRSLRDRDLKSDNQAVSTSEDHQCHKVVMDVRDFMHNDLKVKIVDENELVVEGKVEKKDGGSISTKNFQRSFVFPGLVNSEAVSSTMSSDGVLIITVPKNLQKQNPSHTIHSITKENAKATAASQNVSRVESNQETSKQSLQHQDTSMGSSVHSHFLDHHCSENLMKNLNTENFLPLSDMRSDFHDDFFAKAHQEFESAAKRVFSHCDESTSSTNEMNLFKNLREEVSEEDNQSVSMSEDNHSHKVEIDVRDFVGGDLQVKALEKNELLVEGRLDREEGGRTSTKSFSRRVQLPGAIRVDDITSVLSKNGILIITAPKDFKASIGRTLHIEINDEGVSPNSHQPHSQQRKATSGSTTNNGSQSSTPKHFTVTPF